MEVVKKVDYAILLISENLFTDFEQNLINQFNEFEIPYLIVHNKSDISSLNKDTIAEIRKYSSSDILDFSTVNDEKKEELISDSSFSN